MFIYCSIAEGDESTPVTIFELLQMQKELEGIDARIRRARKEKMSEEEKRGSKPE